MSDGVEKAILAGGCFWGMEDLFRKRPGVVSTRVGYTGGDVLNATYRNHGTHAEAMSGARSLAHSAELGRAAARDGRTSVRSGRFRATAAKSRR